MSGLYLEVVTAPAGSHLKPGTRVELPTSFGRAVEAEVRVMLPAMARMHCRFTVEKGRAYLQDFNSTNGTYVNGVLRNARVELSPGDWVELPWGLSMRLCDEVAGNPPLFDAGSELAQLVEADVHDEGRWRVWSDGLLDRGDVLGERIARGRGADVAEDAKALGPLARDFVAGSLEVEWRHGFMRKAVLRNVTQWPPTAWLETFAGLLAHPLAHFIAEIEVDILSYARGVDRADRTTAEERVLESLELLAQARPLQWLQSMRYGPSPERLWNARLEGAWRKAVARHPRLQVGPIWVARAAWLQLLSTPPGVTVRGLDVGAQRKLEEDGATLVGPLPLCAFHLEAPEGSPAAAVALRLDRENGLWVAEDMAADQYRHELPLYVNGRRCRHARMRPQDVIEPAPGLTFRFVME